MVTTPHRMPQAGGYSGISQIWLVVIIVLLVLLIGLIGYALYLFKKYIEKKEEIDLMKEEGEEGKEQGIQVKEKKGTMLHEEGKGREQKEEIKESQRIPEMISDLREMDILAIINVLKQHDGRVFQKDIPKYTNLSKSTVSRLVRLMEEKGTIERKPVGQTFLVLLRSAEE